MSHSSAKRYTVLLQTTKKYLFKSCGSVARENAAFDRRKIIQRVDKLYFYQIDIFTFLY